VTWTGGSGVLLVILGDLVDGKRKDGMEVNDPRGSFELILLSYLYNLRIKAREAGSEILYTIGNHDYHTVILSIEENEYNINNLNRFVHDKAKRFFKTLDNRRNTLRPFYLTNPYFMLSFMNGSTKEMACVHGGFHNIESGKSYTTAIETYQSKVDTTDSTRLLPMLQTIDTILVTDLDKPLEENGVLWTKTYSQNKNGRCNVLGTEDYPFIVVGHCPTTQNNRALKLMYEGRNGKYNGCSISDHFIIETLKGDRHAAYEEVGSKYREKGVGCVVTDCDKVGHGPRLAFVDTALSEAFRFPTTSSMIKKENTDRYAQFLRLTHVNSSIERYYNKIESVTTNPDNTTVVLYEPDPSTILAEAPPSAVPTAGPPPVSLPVGYKQVIIHGETVYQNNAGRTTKEKPLRFPEGEGWTSLITTNGIEYRKNGVKKYTAEAERAAAGASSPLGPPPYPEHNSRKQSRTKRSNRTNRRRRSRRA
jgi:hypothetical protein